MRALKFKKIDAFAGPRSRGNPAGVVRLDRPGELSADQMLRIGAECKGWVSEVGFVAETGPGSYWLRYYSSEREVDFCGHATIAIAYDLAASEPSLRGVETIRLSIKGAEIEARNRLAEEDAVYVSAPPARRSDRSAPEAEIARALGLEGPGSIAFRAILNAGLETLILEAPSLGAELALSPDQGRLKAFCESIGVDIVLAYSAETSTPGSAYRTRVFAPRFGYLEDPATGSGNAAFGYYLAGTGAWTGGGLLIEQNGSRDEPNFVKLTLAWKDEGGPELRFGGGAKVRLRGEYLI
jgi:PhzF family phenazine biosynthesis protein